MTTLPCIEIETTPNPSASAIWLHGLGLMAMTLYPSFHNYTFPSALLFDLFFQVRRA